MPQIAQRMIDMEATAKVVENLFKTMGSKDSISFSGGAPAAEYLPVDEVREITNRLMSDPITGRRMLQYGFPEGEIELREAIARHMFEPKGMKIDPDHLSIVSGGLETMNLICQVFVNPGDVILVESPTFVHVVEIFEMFQAKCIGVETDENGMVPEDVERKIKEYNPKMVYVIPTFQNPSGRTLTRERRKQIAELGSKYDVLILEDDPYRELRYTGEELPPVKFYDKTGHTVLAGSFSKVFSPGSRIGYVLASPEITQLVYNAKTATNSQTTTLLQLVCAEYLNGGSFDQYMATVKEIYKERRDTMVACAKEFLPEGTRFNVPDGGIFMWVTLPDTINTTEMYKMCADYKVAYIAGEKCFVEGSGDGTHSMRLSYGNVNPEKIRMGMERLGRMCKDYIEQHR